MTSQPPYVLAVDQGTGSTKAIALDSTGQIVAQESISITQAFPHPGWVEQDPQEIAESVRTVLSRIVDRLDGSVIAVGVSTQRESITIWDTHTREPLAPVLSWQDRRTAQSVKELMDHAPEVRETTGLPLDPMFSALKLRWLLKSAGRLSNVTAGTIDSWLIASLTGGRQIEHGNASRTQLLDIATGQWSDRMLEIFSIRADVLPEVVSSIEQSPPIKDIPGLAGVPITAVLADSHASLFANGIGTIPCIKATYGTGSSVMGLGLSDVGGSMVQTIAWSTPVAALALEGNILSTGATLTWLSRLFGKTATELADLAMGAKAGSGLDLVPAFAGLGAPWWDSTASAIISGLTLDTDLPQMAWAALESTALQIEDLIRVTDIPHDVPLWADGGGTMNPALMQLQADLSQRIVLRSDTTELSAVGAAHLAGYSAGIWDNETLLALPRPRTAFHPKISKADADTRVARWRHALERSRIQPHQESDKGV